MEETQARLTKEFSAVCRDYCDISWGKALGVIGIPADSSLRQPESIYYDPEIRELSDPNSSHPEQATQVSELPKVDQVPLAPLEVLKDSHQDASKGKEVETLKGKDKGQDKKKNSSNTTEKASNTAVSQPTKLLTQRFPRRRLRLKGLSYFCFVFFFFFFVMFIVLLFFFFKEMYHLFYYQ